jgi:hypothetical protein
MKDLARGDSPAFQVRFQVTSNLSIASPPDWTEERLSWQMRELSSKAENHNHHHHVGCYRLLERKSSSTAIDTGVHRKNTSSR